MVILNSNHLWYRKSGLTLNSIKVTLFSSTNCAFGTESAILTMNGAGGVNFPAGTYTSSNASNYALAQRFGSESTYVAFNANSVRFDYLYNSANSGPGWVSANCMESTGIGNYDKIMHVLIILNLADLTLFK